MVKRICPICDQVMKSSHFCWNCRTWIKHPYEREMNFYLNERHPGNESQCEYHGTDQTYSGGTAASGGIYADADLNRQMNKQTRGNSSQMAGARLGGSGMPGGGTRPGGSGMSGSGTRPGGNGMSGSGMRPGGNGMSGSGMRSGGSGMPGSGMGVGGNGMPGSGTRSGGNGMPGSMQVGSVRPASPNMAGAGQGSSAYGQRSPGSGPQVTAQLVKSGKGAYVIVVVAVIIVLLIAVGTTFMGRLYGVIEQNMSDGILSGEYGSGIEEWSDENYRELEDEEVKAAGVHCNTYYHFLVKEEAIAPAVSDAILSAGYKIASETTYSYNDATLEGDEEWTYYSTSHTIYVAGDGMTIRDDLSQWVELDSDTATGEIHSYNSQLGDKTKSLMIMTEFVKGIESSYGIGSEKSCVPEVTRDMQTGLDETGSYSYESDLLYITAQLYSDGLYLQVSCNQAD